MLIIYRNISLYRVFVSISIRFYARHYRSKFRNFSPTSTARTIILFTTYDRNIVHTSSPLPSTCYKMKIRKIGSESMTISNNSDVSTLKTRGAKLAQNSTRSAHLWRRSRRARDGQGPTGNDPGRG